LYISPLTSIFFIIHLFSSLVKMILNFHFLILRIHDVQCKGVRSYHERWREIISFTILSNVTLIFIGKLSIFFCRALVIFLTYVLNTQRKISDRCSLYQNQITNSIFQIWQYLRVLQQAYCLWIHIFRDVIIQQDILLFWILNQLLIHIDLLT